jgi:hypothetical protein
MKSPAKFAFMVKVIAMQFLYRLKIACTILFTPKGRWVFLRIDEEGFNSLLVGDGRDVDVKISFHRMQEYNMWHLIRSAGATKDEVDMMLEKAKFEAQAQEYSEKKKSGHI